jgi:hypothetical protein
MSEQEFLSVDAGKVFAKGEIENSPKGIYMTDSNPGKLLCWVAKKGYNEDWVIYIYWDDAGYEYCTTNGDKVQNEANIKKLLPGCDGILNRYRH